MTFHKRLGYLVLTLGLASGAAVATAGAAEASTPTCQASVFGVMTDGKVVRRDVTNTRVDKEWVSPTALPFAVNSMVYLGGETVTGGSVVHVNTFTAKGRPHNVDLGVQDGSTDLTVTPTDTFARSFGPRLVAGSGRYYAYAVDGNGRLKRWTRERDSADHLWFDSSKLVARHMRGLKTLSYSWTYKVNGGWRDVLYGTTKGGALKQFQIPWKKPGKVKITTIKKSGFKAFTGLSLSFCGTNTKYLSIVAIDRVHNRARWYTLPKALTPRGSHLVRRGLVAPGSDWRLHATF